MPINIYAIQEQTILAKIAYKQYYKDRNINNDAIEAIYDAFF